MSKLQIYKITMGTSIEDNPDFAEKGLAAFSVNPGVKCDHGCRYCFVNQPSNQEHGCFDELNLDPRDLDYAILDPSMPDRVAEEARRIPEERRGVVELCTRVDAWSPAAQKLDLGRKCLEAILEVPGWEVRILTKNAAVEKDFKVVEKYRDRVTVGLSLTGTADKADILKVIEPYASPLPERMKAMQRAHKLGLRTYGMLCPLLPGIADDPKQIDELVRFVEACGAEEIFVEAVNARVSGLRLTQEALEAERYNTEASAIEQIRRKVNWSPYCTTLVANVQEVMRKYKIIDKLRLLQYPSDLTDEDDKRIRKDDEGVIWLKSTLTPESQQIIKKIQRLQGKEHKPKAALLRLKVQIGDALNDLKRGIEHGEWKVARRKAGYYESAAQRLMRLSGSWLGGEIRNKDSVLAKRLPVDLQKLDMLVRLLPKQFEQLSDECLCLDTMDRSALRRKVNALLHPDKAQKPVRMDATQAADSLRTLCQAANDLKSSASKLDPKEMDTAIDTLQDVLTFLEKLKSRSSKPSTAVIPPVNVPIDSTSSPAIA